MNLGKDTEKNEANKKKCSEQFIEAHNLLQKGLVFVVVFMLNDIIGLGQLL